jgi:N-acetylated-alpha-linked acidic dipeptidase
MARANCDEDPGSTMIRSRPVSFLALETSPKTLLLAVEAAAQGQQGVALFHGLRWIGGLLRANAAAVAGRVGKSTRGDPQRAVSAASRRALTAALVVCAALHVPAASARADTAMLGFGDSGAEAQRTLEKRFQRGLSADAIRRASRWLSRRQRLTGTAGVRRAFRYSVKRLRAYGLTVSTPSYRVYASRPRDISVTMTAPYARNLSNRERAVPGHRDPDDVVVAYNAYSPSGDVSGEVVYANRGLPRDYAELERLGVDVRDRILLVRYGGSFRGVKSQQAEQRGAKGVLLYSDPADDGFTRGPVYPDGPWRPADGIQRGTIEYLFQYPGDPLTPGAASVPGTRRIAPEQARNLPRIPTTPISSGDARPLLEALGGPEAPVSFRGGLPITYRPGPGGTKVRLDLDIAYGQTPVRNILATIRGATRPEEKVVVGGHYDAWTYGAGDNASGWTTIMEIGRSLGRLLDRGWRPERTIVLAGWDGEEHGLLGSTEWVEQFRRDLRRDAVAYVNLSQVGGTRFYASGVPQIDDALIEATKAVTDPRTGRSVYNVWKDYEGAAPKLGRLGSGSDYTAFLEHAGVPALDASFSSPASTGTYHSAYDDTHNLERHLDPGYLGHLGSARVAGVTALRLANANVLPLHYSDYAAAVSSYVRELQDVAATTPGASQVELGILLGAASSWRRASKALEANADRLLETDRAESSPAHHAIARINHALMRQERALTTRHGLPGRPWYRHQIYAPGLATGYAVQFLPGLRDALERGDDATVRARRDLLLDSLRTTTRLAERGVREGSRAVSRG